MKNKEKFADILLDLLVENERVAIGKETGKPCACCNSRCDNCLRKTDGCTEKALREWLEEEYEEPKVDWSKVPVDAKVYVRDDERTVWKTRHFAKFKENKVYVWSNGKTSFTTPNKSMINYNYAKLAEEGKE